ncbi:ABC exporter membrane fusion protein [soil metagenome]
MQSVPGCRRSPRPEFRVLLFLTAVYLGFAPLAQAQVSALGRIEPYQGTLRVTAPSTPDNIGGVMLGKLMVERGSDVTAGQVLAITEAAPLLVARLAQAHSEREYRNRQAIAAHSQATSVCVRSTVAANVSKRRQDLLARKLTSSEDAERAKGDADASKADCAAARAEAGAAAGAVALADAEIKTALANQQRAIVRAPVAGRVIDIHVRPGEVIGMEGILDLARIERMYAIAEVYETEINQVRVGQPATITSRALGRKLTGTVERIRQQVRKLDQMGTDPAARKDARIIEVEVRLDDPAVAASLTNLQVEVVIGRRDAK